MSGGPGRADGPAGPRPAEEPVGGPARPGPPLRVLLTADTHVPRRARDLPEELWRQVDAADVVVHAGDWVSEDLLDRLERRCRVLVGVFGNNDGPGLRRRLPEVARADLAGLRLAVVHETGPAKGRAGRCAARFPGTDLLVFGHSHIPWDEQAPGGPRLLNPGSPTDRRRQPSCTFMTLVLTPRAHSPAAARIAGGQAPACGADCEVVLHRLPSRGR